MAAETPPEPSSELAGNSTLGFGIPYTDSNRTIVNYSVGAICLVIGLAGILGNGSALYVFIRFKRSLGVGGRLILNLASADFMVSVLHFMPAVSSFRQIWAFGAQGCQIYAGLVGLGSLVSLITLALLAIDRSSIIAGKPRPWISGWKACGLTWLFCIALVAPPLVGWSQYQLEGLGTFCSWDYTTRTWQNRSYHALLLLFGFIVPISVIFWAYAGILKRVWRLPTFSQQAQLVTGQMRKLKMLDENDIKIAKIVSIVIICFLLSWTPFVLISLIGQYGDPDLLTPMATTLPAIFAKASVVYNPLLYGQSHPKFRSLLRSIRGKLCFWERRGRSEKSRRRPHPRRSTNWNQMNRATDTRVQALVAGPVQVVAQIAHYRVASATWCPTDGEEADNSFAGVVVLAGFDLNQNIPSLEGANNQDFLVRQQLRTSPLSEPHFLERVTFLGCRRESV